MGYDMLRIGLLRFLRLNYSFFAIRTNFCLDKREIQMVNIFYDSSGMLIGTLTFYSRIHAVSYPGVSIAMSMLRCGLLFLSASSQSGQCARFSNR